MADPGKQPALIAITFLFPACSLMVVIVRFWRRIVERTFAGEDIVLGVAMVSNPVSLNPISSGYSREKCLKCLLIAYCGVDYTLIKLNYIGYRDEDVPPGVDFQLVLKYLYVESIIYNPILCLIKASFLWTLMKLRSHRVWINRTLWAIQGINAMFMVATTLATIFACTPVKAYWDFAAMETAKCNNTAAYVISSICIVLFTDILVVSIPVCMIYDLHMSRARKIITISFLSFGLAVTAIGAVRLHHFIELFVFERNSSYSISQSYSTMESNIAIIGACGPTVKWILSRCIPWLENPVKSSAHYKPSSSALSRGERRTYTNTVSGTFASRQRDDDYMYTSRDQEAMELKGGPGWKNQHSYVEADERSDTLNGDAGANSHGIMKTVEWNIASGEQHPPARMGNGSESRLPAVKPKDVL
ncbi:hypothetical protein AJ80_05679 [Polytolypa hystricis UAMH7299]|uniref:Rhodopsin domain-containing protein n=1 Tax=Polytolypa hystricis (strain UAMH7299) TaxID=1447883 RepID=A0A2B7XTG3_POLH7|nr:hypothetical protein AJ80_05679 [Polytolypa hystricis UAMH7299]